MREWEDCQAFRMGGTELKDERGERQTDRKRLRDAAPYIVSVFGLVDEVVINYSVEQHRTRTAFQGFH